MKTRKKLWIFLLSLFCLVLGGCGAQEGETEAEAPGVSWESLSFPQELEILYATQFSAASSPEGYTKISIEDGLSYLVVPEGAAVPSGVPAEITVIQQPLDHIYLAATSAMDLFRALEAIDRGYPVRRGGGTDGIFRRPKRQWSRGGWSMPENTGLQTMNCFCHGPVI